MHQVWSINSCMTACLCSLTSTWILLWKFSIVSTCDFWGVLTFQHLCSPPSPLSHKNVVFVNFFPCFEFVLRIISLQIGLEIWNLICKLNIGFRCTFQGLRLFSLIALLHSPQKCNFLVDFSYFLSLFIT